MIESKTDSIVTNYNPTVCDLCGSDKFRIILDVPDGSMTSDAQIVKSGLRKIQCLDCDLIRNGYALSYEWLRTHYEEEYELGEQASIAEPLFFTEHGPVTRSRAIFNWMIENLKEAGSGNPRTAIEVGCGEGSLLSHFADLGGCNASGVDMSWRSVQRANERGLSTRRGSYRDVAGSFDLIFSFAVIEHVPSPSDFLSHLGSCLAREGVLLTAQPCQDSGSYDIFFSDHLHHFFSDHVAELGRRAGLREIRRVKTNPYISDFSLHIFAKDEATVHQAPQLEKKRLEPEWTVEKWEGIFARLNKWLELNRNRELAIWGVGEMFSFLSAYTDLKQRSIEVAFDDNPERFANSGFEFPIVKFDDSQSLDPDTEILLTFIPRSQVIERLRAGSAKYFCPLKVCEE